LGCLLGGPFLFVARVTRRRRLTKAPLAAP
jgi:hypothetical protein